MSAVGYNLLIEQLGLSATPLASPAIVRPVTRIEKIGHVLAVPQNLAPPATDILGHTLFALKHEGVNLAVLAQVLPGIPAGQLEQASQESPTVSICARCATSGKHLLARSCASTHQ